MTLQSRNLTAALPLMGLQFVPGGSHPHVQHPGRRAGRRSAGGHHDARAMGAHVRASRATAPPSLPSFTSCHPPPACALLTDRPAPAERAWWPPSTCQTSWARCWTPRRWWPPCGPGRAARARASRWTASPTRLICPLMWLPGASTGAPSYGGALPARTYLCLRAALCTAYGLRLRKQA